MKDYAAELLATGETVIPASNPEAVDAALEAIQQAVRGYDPRNPAGGMDWRKAKSLWEVVVPSWGADANARVTTERAKAVESAIQLSLPQHRGVVHIFEVQQSDKPDGAGWEYERRRYDSSYMSGREYTPECEADDHDPENKEKTVRRGLFWICPTCIRRLDAEKQTA